MTPVDADGVGLAEIVTLLAAGVVAVPVFMRLGLGAVLGYFCAGVFIGPWGSGLIVDPEAILQFAEFGIIMLLFVIGLEMQPSRLWNLRGEIFGLGLAQVLLCGALLTLAGWLAGLAPATAFVAGMGFVMSSTAVVTQMLDDAGERTTDMGQRATSILLFEDLSIVPLLAMVALLSPTGWAEADNGSRLLDFAVSSGCFVVLILAGRFLLNPMFGVLARARAREVMTAAALLVVLGAAWLMELGGLSMAMGAFLAGVMLSESSFRHQLAQEIEPFRGILLGLFFLAVGMSLNLSVMVHAPWLILGMMLSYTALKAAGIFAVARLFGASSREAVLRVSQFSQGGEFAFVLYATATSGGLLTMDENATFTAVVILSMAMTPLTAKLVRRLLPDGDGRETATTAPADETPPTVLVIGCGRFGQVACQGLLARHYAITIVDRRPDAMRVAQQFTPRALEGDATQLAVLKAAGVRTAEAVLVCIDDPAATTRIVALLQEHVPLARLFVRAYDRGHALALARQGVDFEVREIYESAMRFGAAVLGALGEDPDLVTDTMDAVRRLDEERFALQLAGDEHVGADLMRDGQPVPAPLSPAWRRWAASGHPSVRRRLRRRSG